ncbi:alpha/beta hydrolase [Roseovarius aestuarii]|nr:alpha/beta hydrolase [Roseovarius aestuarii]
MGFHTADDGCRLWLEQAGQGGPLVMLIPGLGGDGRFWSAVASRLEASYRLLMPDHRGAGRSDRPDGEYSIGRITRDIVSIIAAQTVPVHVVGHSTGGAIVQTLALDYPGVAASHVISSSWARSDARFRMLFKARADLLHANMPETYQRLTNILGYDSAYLATHEDTLDGLVATAADRLAPLGVTAQRVEMLLDHDRLLDLGRIRGPVRVIGAQEDHLTPLSMSRDIANAIPGAEFEIVEGGHFHPVSHPDAFAQCLNDFLSKVTE